MSNFPANPMAHRLPPKLEFIPYPEMVQRLFKEMGSDAATLMHAAIGISGEATELIIAVANDDEKNLIEEAGDMFFYIQKILTTFTWNPHLFGAPISEPCVSARPEVNLTVAAGTVLDLIKKYWVYNKPIDLVQLCHAMARVMYHYFDLLHDHGLDFEDVLYENQVKLIGPNGRFKDLAYSDAAAQARADKAPGE